MLNFINNKTCLFCENKNTKQILNLGEQPLADSFIPKDKLIESGYKDYVVLFEK